VVDTVKTAGVGSLPLAPRNPLPYVEKVKAVRSLNTGLEKLRDAGGSVTRLRLGPKWLMPPIVVTTSPQGGRDVLGRKDAFIDKTLPFNEDMRRLYGRNLFNMAHDDWLPVRRSIQPVFTKQHVRQLGGHMAQAAETVTATWREGAVLDLDTECRKLTLRALGRSVLGLNLDERAEALGEPMRITLEYVSDRGVRPVRAPWWLPTPARHRARASKAAMQRLAADILSRGRADPSLDAPLVHALIAATDPATGRSLTDEEICDELIVFLIAGHDTTATTLTYALWAMGHHPDIQNRVAAEVDQLGERRPAPDDVARLPYTIQVLNESLRLCPPGPALHRMAVQDIEVDGYRVETGTMVIFGIYALHRDPKLWDDPLKFDPDRFSPDNSKGRDRWQYVPFGGGPRSCIGDHFAMLEAALALATIMQHVEVQSLDDDFPMAVPFTMVAGGPIRARIKRRDSEDEAVGGRD
jgi:cytochrome P450